MGRIGKGHFKGEKSEISDDTEGRKEMEEQQVPERTGRQKMEVGAMQSSCRQGPATVAGL